MADTTSPLKGYALQQSGNNPGTWGVILNSDVFSIIDNNLGGTLNKSVAGAVDITLSSSEAENLNYNLTGALTGNINVIWPTGAGLYIVTNSTTGSFTLTVKPTGGTGVPISQGTTVIVFISTVTGTAFVAGSSVSVPVLVPQGGTGLTSLTLNNVILGNGTSAVQVVDPGTSGNVLASDGTTFSSTSGYARLGVAQSFTKSQGATPVALTSTSNSTAIDFSLSNNFSATLTENTIFANPTNIVAGKTYNFDIINGSGPYTVGYGSFFKFPGGTVPSVTATNGASDLLVAYAKTTTFLECVMINGFA